MHEYAKSVGFVQRRAALAALDGDDWAWFVQHAGWVAQRVDALLKAERLAPLRAKPGQQAGGPGKRAVLDLLSSEPVVWQQFVKAADLERPSAAVCAVLSRWQIAFIGDDAAVDSSDDVLESVETEPDERHQRLRSRLKQALEQRDAARRQLTGAEARASSAESDLVQAQRQIDRLQGKRTALQNDLDELARQLERSTDREQRRAAGEHQRLRDELRQLRRKLETCEQRARDASERRSLPRVEAHGSITPPPGFSDPRIVPGRPTLLPQGLDLRSREAAELLLNVGRLVIVDGYNVTKQHHVSGDLEQQRRWLTQIATRVSQRQRIRCQLVFDGQHPSGSRLRGQPDVQISFTGAGVTADDEIVLRVEAIDEPVVVVTDDRDLVARARASDADVLPTGPFVWLGTGG